MPRLHAFALALSFLAACAAPGDDSEAADRMDALGKADALYCADAARDVHGYCRRTNGQFAPAACCPPEDACYDIEKDALALCPGASPAWEDCLGALGIGEGAAALCCAEHSDLGFCGALPFGPAASLPLEACLALEPTFLAACTDAIGAPLGDPGSCLTALGSDPDDAASCCSSYSSEFGWCPGAAAAPAVDCDPAIPSPVATQSAALESSVVAIASYAASDAAAPPPTVASQFFRALVLLELVDAAAGETSLYGIPDADTFEVAEVVYGTGSAALEAGLAALLHGRRRGRHCL